MEYAITTAVKDHAAKSRYELEVDGQVAFVDYRRDGATLILSYVEAPIALRGTGAAGNLMEGVMQKVRAEGLKVVPRCSYAASWLQRHKEYADLIS